MARKAGIDRNAVVRAAIAIADADGLEALTLAKVAATLGIRSPSLYSHIDGLDGLKLLLTAEGGRQMASALRDAATGSTGSDALRAFSHAYRQFAHDHPGIYDASQHDAPRPDDDPELAATLAEPVAVVARALTQMGVAPHRHIDLIRAMRAGLHGFVLLERNAGFGLPDDIEASFETLVDLLVAGAAQA